MNRGCWICRRPAAGAALAAAALTATGCFNPQARDETGTTTVATSGSPGTTSTTAATTGLATGTSASPGGTSTTDLPPTTTDATTAEETTTVGPHVEFVALTSIAYSGAYGVVTADLDKITAQDLVVSSASPGNLNFASYLGPDLETVTTTPSGVATAFTGADFELDGDTDIVAALIGVPAVLVGYRRVDPEFMNFAGTALPAPCTNPNWVAVAQLNPSVDAYIDAVVACTDLDGGVLIVPGELNGSFGPPTAVDYAVTVASVGLAQVRGSPALDLILVSSADNVIHVVTGADNLDFDPMLAQPIQAPAPFGFAVGSLDDDGYADFGVASLTGGCPLLRGAAAVLAEPEIHPCGAGPVDLVLGDLNRDTLTDLVSIHPGELHIAYGEADGTIGAPDVLSAAAAPWRVALGDYDGDTLLDIALTAPDQLLVFLQTPG